MKHPFNRRDWTIHNQGSLKFVARHPILTDIARTMASFDLQSDLLHQDVSIFVGAHSFTRRVLTRGRRIGIQTEQYLDENGRKLWGCPSRLSILRNAMQYDLLIDLSEANAPAYHFLPQAVRKKVRFGPYIFPNRAPAYQPGDEPPVFFGALNARRSAALEEMQIEKTILPEGVFGESLRAAIQRSKAVVNLHFQGGVYTEYPRLLTAIMAGKPVISERLASPLRIGEHYLAVGDALDETLLQQSYKNMARLLTTKYRFSLLLEAFLADCNTRVM